MQLIDIFVLALAALCVFYLPFVSAQLVMKLLYGRRRAPTRSVVVVGLADSVGSRLAAGPVASAAVLVLTDPVRDGLSVADPSNGSPVLDVDGLLRYLTDERASDAEALLVQFLDEPNLVPPRR